MSWLFLTCNECQEEVEVYCDADHAMICPECRSIDNFCEDDLATIEEKTKIIEEIEIHKDYLESGELSLRKESKCKIAIKKLERKLNKPKGDYY